MEGFKIAAGTCEGCGLVASILRDLGFIPGILEAKTFSAVVSRSLYLNLTVMSRDNLDFV